MKGRRNSRWQEMDKSGIELSRLIQFYETFDRSEGKSPRTVAWYTEVLSLFLDWLQLNGKPTNIVAKPTTSIITPMVNTPIN